MDVPDRLPYEAADRLFAGTPALDGEHSVQPVYLVAATKPGQSTARPFARVHPRDLLLYQSLVDALREPIESTLGSRDEILAYRMAPIDQDDALSASPRWKDFNDAVRGFASKNPEHYLVQADVSSFYISIRTPELSRRLLESGADGDVVRDLDDLLGAWAADGVQGLPQGLMASSFLANFYLAPIDSVLRDEQIPFWRYMDDLWFAANSHHAARRTLDLVEARLYEDGLTLGGGKTRVVRASSAEATLTTFAEQLDEVLREMIENEDPYTPSEDAIEDWKLDQIKALYDDCVEGLRRDNFRRSELIFAFRALGRAEDGYALETVEYVLLRIPGLTQQACNYMSQVANPGNRERLNTALETLILQREFHRTQEWLHLLRAATTCGDQTAPSLVDRLAQLSEEDPHPLVRARALLAWGRQSPTDDFSKADSFFARERESLLTYALVSVQGKANPERNLRYEQWSGSGRSLAQLAESLRAAQFSWSAV